MYAFAALSSLGNDDSLADESSIETLQQSLESALGDAATDITLDQDIPEAEEISGNDVGSAFADLFGEEDDMDSFGETTESNRCRRNCLWSSTVPVWISAKVLPKRSKRPELLWKAKPWPG